MKIKLFICFVCVSFFSFCQTEEVSIIDYVQVVNKNKAETLYYYQNNWEQLRIKALEKGYIKNYNLLETKPTQETPYTFILITTYKNKAQYEASETNFQEIINNSGGLKLLNSKTPPEFRKVILNNDHVIHWN